MRIGTHFCEEGALWGCVATVEVAGIARPVQHRTVGEELHGKTDFLIVLLDGSLR